MARFLSPEWFGELEAAEGVARRQHRAPTGQHRGRPLAVEADEVHDGPGAPTLVVQISVTGAPEGDVRYQVVVEGTQPRVVPPGSVFGPAQVELSTDYATVADIARGRLSAIDALSRGRARVSGDAAALSTHGPGLAGLDLVPPTVRARTTY